MNFIIRWILTVVPLIATLALSTDHVEPGQHFTLAMVVTGHTEALVTLQQPIGVQLQRLDVFGSPAGNCQGHLSIPVCHAQVVTTTPVLIVATYYVNPSTPVGIYSIRAEINDLNTGDLQVIERGFKVGIMEAPPAIDRRFEMYFPIVL